MNSHHTNERLNGKYKLGITLSGGGARGILHIGVLEAFHQHGLHPDIVSGTNKALSVLQKYIPVDDFSSLKIPFYCSVTNLNSGLSETKSSGSLFQWVLASASIPLVFEPQNEK